MVLYYVLGAVLAIALYFRHVNDSMAGTPDVVKPFAVKPFTEEQIKRRYQEVQAEGHTFSRHLPPKTGRRYIVSGGAGYLGKWAVLHLIQRGESPSAIRIIDIRDPVAIIAHDEVRGADKFNEYEPLRRACASVQFIKTDITNAQSVREAFEAPWPADVKDRPLTVFHCAALIRHWERAAVFLPRQAPVNVDGTRNVIAAAKAAGATVLISTSSSSVGVRRANFWLWPWQRWATNLAQVISDDSPNLPKSKNEFFSNYSYTKFLAEGHVRAADEKSTKGGLRTGIIRPGNGIYGPGGDFTAGTYLRLGGGPRYVHYQRYVSSHRRSQKILTRDSWIYHVIQDFINVENCMLAHLCYEACLINLASSKPGDKPLPDIGGQSFFVTDPKPTVRFSDVYRPLEVLATTKIKFTRIPPIALFPMAHLLEWYDVLSYYVAALPQLQFPLRLLQPALFFVSNVHTIVDDSRARAKPQDGGIGYNPPIDTLSGLCFQIGEWNKNVEREKGRVNGKIDVTEKLSVDEVLQKATGPVPRKA